MNKSRLKFSLINSSVAVFSQAAALILSFVSRTIFIRVLGESYLGLNGLFTNLLNLLSFAELGIGSAMTYALYEPIAHNDIFQIKALMNLYRKLYHIIAAVILVTGLIFTPFLGFFIKSGYKSVGNIYVAFVLFLLGSVTSYFMTYKRTFFLANQFGYVNSLNTLIFQLITQVLQIAFLLLYPSYYLYLIVQIVFTVLSNFQISKMADKRFPYLKFDKNYKIKSSIKTKLKRNIFGMISSKFGGIIVNGTDNLILSTFIGLSTVAVYTNYTLVLNGLINVINQGVSAVTASIGNLQVDSKKDKQRSIFFEYSFVSSQINLIASIGSVTFFSPFIKLWVGKEYVLSNHTTFLIVLSFYTSQLRQVNINTTNAYGLYWEQRIRPIFELVVNLTISIVLVKYFSMGIGGVVLGTLLGNLLINSWWEPLIIVKVGFKDSFIKYYCYYFFELILGGVLIYISLQLSSFIDDNYLLYRLFISCLLMSFCFLIFDFLGTRFFENKYGIRSTISFIPMIFTTYKKKH